jgi:hypothetical protein
MKSRHLLLVTVALLICAAAALLLISSKPSTASAAQTQGISSAVEPQFFGDLLSRQNDYFYQSTLAIYRERYVADDTSGHFSISQSGEAGRKGNIRQKRTDRGESEPAPAEVPATTISLLSGKDKVDPDIDSSPNQRQITPDVVQTFGPISQDRDLRDLPFIAVTPESDEVPLRRHPRPETAEDRATKTAVQNDVALTQPRPQSASSAMPAPIQSFDGMNAASACGNCLPPDTDGDVGPSHYIQLVNGSIRITGKTGTVLSGPTTYNSFFAALGPATPCGTRNVGDGIAFYDHLANRWVVSDFAFISFPGTIFYQCIGVSKTADPVAGGWWLYAVQVDPANPTFLGDYPKFGMWSDAYYMSVNEFSNNTTFQGVRVYAFDRNSMMNGNPANTIAFSILPADLGDQYSLVPSSFRTGIAPPVGRPNMFMDVNSSGTAGTVETQVFVRRFHVDFATPANSTFGADPLHHAPDGIVTVNGFVDAFVGAGNSDIVPQNGTGALLDTLGDKLMYPLVYQNLGGIESIYAVQTVNNNQGGTGPTAIRWYQFDVTGNTVPTTPAQQQTFNNGGDGLWRFMPSINVDKLGNMAIGYATSGTTIDPGIRYAGRFVTDPASTLAQGEVVLQAGVGSQAGARWGDYSTMFVDPNDNCTFFHANEYYNGGWATRIGSFAFPGCSVPTAARVAVSGRVLTSDGRGLRNAVVTMTDGTGQIRRTLTGAFGYYRFEDVELGDHVISVVARSATYSPRLLNIRDELAGLDFTPQR